MKKDIHPEYKPTKFYCSCGNEFHAASASKKEAIELDICSKCHPFYTGQQKLVDTAGRVERFLGRYGKDK